MGIQWLRLKSQNFVGRIVAHISEAIAYRIDLIYLLFSCTAFEVGWYEADTNSSLFLSSILFKLYYI